LDDGVPAIYDTSWKFQPSYLGHISEIINKIIERGINKEIIPISVDGLYSRYDVAKDILTPFGIVVSAVDKGDITPIIIDDQSKLKEQNLPIYNYQEVIEKIIKEIKYRNIYILN